MMIAANALVVMTKAPQPGQSKTRLVPPLSFENAAALAGALLRDQLDNVGKFTGAQLCVAYSAPSPVDFLKAFVPRGFSAFAQRGGDLGERMGHAFQHLFERGARKVVLVGADLPPVPLEFLEQAFALLNRPDVEVVLGPSLDGGYYLIGMNQPTPETFEDMIWSRHDVLARTMEKLDRFEIKYGLVPCWYDIDTPEDLALLQSRPIAVAEAMKSTLNLLHGLRGKGRL